MTPASNSGARKRTEAAARPPSVLVEIPVTEGEQAVRWLHDRIDGDTTVTELADDTEALIAVVGCVEAALDARIGDDQGSGR